MNTVIENMGLWSILPPLLTVIVALAFKDVVLALLSGIFSGLLIVNRGDVVIAALQMVDRIASSLCDAWNIRIFLFCALLGSFVAILSRTGSAYAFGSWAANRIKSRKGTMFFTFFFGILIFIDDYFNSLSVGTAMRPVCDRMKISRAKLAYLLDSTAAPICIIAPVSSWVVTVMSY
ncbi:MAG: Na+/H+ antiporter NhaC family protein, partial [Lentisphaeria bacterium]|nr:Na+/H+ antiporter NhaC family protein [Lentisphaeria bacterium]